MASVVPTVVVRFAAVDVLDIAAIPIGVRASSLAPAVAASPVPCVVALITAVTTTASPAAVSRLVLTCVGVQIVGRRPCRIGRRASAREQ